MKPHSRREFFRSAGTVGAGLAAGAVSVSASVGRRPNNDELGLLYDATKCVGCKACMAACKRVNAAFGGLAVERASFDEDSLWDSPRDLSGGTRTIIKVGRAADRSSFVKHSCMHCQNPACVSACPVKAMTKDPVTGIISYRKSTCIGCRYCQIACPFNIPKFQWERAVPQIVKCDLCRSTDLKDKGIPACADTCPTGAILFGKRSELLKEAGARLNREPRRYVRQIYGEHEAGGTNVLLLAAIPFPALGLPRLGPESPVELSERIQHTIYKGLVAPAALLLALGAIARRNQRRSGSGHSAGPLNQPRQGA